MADRHIWTTASFRRHGAGAKITCRTCGHAVQLSSAIIEAMFPRPTPLEMARRRLRCTACGSRDAAIQPIHRPLR